MTDSKTNKYREQVEKMFAEKRERLENAKLFDTEGARKPLKVKPKNDALDLHYYNNYGEKNHVINKRQKALNELYAKLSKEDKKTLKDAFAVVSDYNPEIDWL